jgi:hypothetical protein
MMTNKERKTILLSDLPIFKGKFTWNQADLIANIRASKPDFNTRDPKTWPRMTWGKLNRDTGNTYNGERELPIGLVYDSQIVFTYTDEDPHDGTSEISFRKGQDGHPVCLNRSSISSPSSAGATARS